jgi:hypothetical protein
MQRRNERPDIVASHQDTENARTRYDSAIQLTPVLGNSKNFPLVAKITHRLGNGRSAEILFDSIFDVKLQH